MKSGEDTVGYLKIIKDKSSKAESRTPDAGLIISQHCSTKARGSKPASQPTLQHQGARVDTRVSASTAAPRCVGRHPRLSQHCNTKAYGSTPASQPALQRQGAWVDTRVSVVTALVMGSITAHIMGKVNPHYGVFLGGTFAPETSINSPVAMEKGSVN